jgi:hypothetical protein
MKLSLRRKRSPAPAEITRVYTSQGRTAHLMADGKVLCPTVPVAGAWKGLTPEEAEYAAVLPLCAYCRDALAANGGGAT